MVLASTVRPNAPKVSSAFHEVSPMIVCYLLLPLFSLFLTTAYAQQRRNITVDDTSPLITYTPDASWTVITGDLDAGGSHRLTLSSSAFATVNYTFASFYFMSVKWPYRVITQLTIDDQQTMIVDLQDHTVPDVGSGGGTVQSSVVAQYQGTTNMEHTIRVSIPPGDLYAVVDMFIFEITDPDPTSSTSVSPSSSSTPDSTSTSATDIPPPSNSAGASGGSESLGSRRTLAIALGVAGPIVALFLLFLLWWFCFRRKKHAADYPISKPVLDLNSPSDLPSDPTSPSCAESGGYSGTSGTVSAYGPFVPYIPPTPSAPTSERAALRPSNAYQSGESSGPRSNDGYDPYDPEHQALSRTSTAGATAYTSNASSYSEGLATLSAATVGPLRVRNKSGPSRPQTAQSSLQAPIEEPPGYSPGEYHFSLSTLMRDSKGDSSEPSTSRSQPSFRAYPADSASLALASSAGQLGQGGRLNRPGPSGPRAATAGRRPLPASSRSEDAWGVGEPQSLKFAPIQ
ncbi:unnamed protein product [Cyclocybe aegerita]|uniref:Uncharacterized protein n=1 Tax=Cyclocybe aegerita TaxID=1973307 RepID=A0A8S0WZT2_CYCAE|nr:unnamed protein product [Cyclocybe aegerita]